jgi:hypothetical protein
MNKFPLPVVLALALSASVGFSCGYVFYSGYGEARSAAAQAIVDAQAAQRVLQAYEPILITSRFHEELAKIETMEGVEGLRQKYRDLTLRNISHFEQQSGKLELPNERALAAPFLEAAAKVRGEVEHRR